MSNIARNLKILIGTAALACASLSLAGENVDWSVTVGSGGYGYPPPVRVYTPPPAVVYTPPPVYYRPAPVVGYQSYYYGQPHWEHRDWHRHHHYGHHNHHGRYNHHGHRR